MTTPTRDRIHQLVDSLSERELAAVERFLAQLQNGDDPVLRALAAAPEDDEPLTSEDQVAIQEAYADLAAGRTIPDDEVRRRLDFQAQEGRDRLLSCADKVYSIP